MSEDVEEGVWDEEKVVYTWKVFRVKFLTAWFMMTRLEMADDEVEDLTDGVDQYVDANGVLQMPWYEHELNEFPELENRVPYGPGAAA